MALGQRPVTKPAAGNAKNTGAPGPTPAPLSEASLALAKDRSMGRENYGSNAYDGKVYADPGKTTTSPLADELKTFAQTDGELDRVIAKGTARQDESITGQLRKIADGNVPNHPHMNTSKFPAQNMTTGQMGHKGNSRGAYPSNYQHRTVGKPTAFQGKVPSEQ